MPDDETAAPPLGVIPAAVPWPNRIVSNSGSRAPLIRVLAGTTVTRHAKLAVAGAKHILSLHA